MKLTKTLTATLTALTFVIVGCEDKKTDEAADPHAGHNHAAGEHGKPASDPHAGHDHDKDEHKDHKGHDHGADEHKDHDHANHSKKVAGPNGGRIITTVDPHAEFFVTEDRKVRITFLGENNKAIAVAAQFVSIVCGDRSNPTNLTLVKEADGLSLLSSGTLPADKSFPAIVTFKATPDATPVFARFTVNLADCPTCKYKEYACTCDHGHDH